MKVVLFWGLLLVVLPLVIGWFLGERSQRGDGEK